MFGFNADFQIDSESWILWLIFPMKMIVNFAIKYPSKCIFTVIKFIIFDDLDYRNPKGRVIFQVIDCLQSVTRWHQCPYSPY